MLICSIIFSIIIVILVLLLSFLILFISFLHRSWHQSWHQNQSWHQSEHQSEHQSAFFIVQSTNLAPVRFYGKFLLFELLGSVILQWELLGNKYVRAPPVPTFFVGTYQNNHLPNEKYNVFFFLLEDLCELTSSNH